MINDDGMTDYPETEYEDPQETQNEGLFSGKGAKKGLTLNIFIIRSIFGVILNDNFILLYFVVFRLSQVT